MTHPKMSIRQLARRIGWPESTVRTVLKYPKAYEVRRLCAGDEQAAEEIADLTIDQVKMFNHLPPAVANAWLDVGAESYHLHRRSDAPVQMVADWITQTGLAEFLMPNDFQGSMARLFDIAKWCKEHNRIQRIESYARSVAKRSLPHTVLELIPCQSVDDDGFAVLITVKQWGVILAKCVNRYDDEFTLQAAVQSGVRAVLKKEGHDLSDVDGPIIAEMMQVVEKAPECIQKADCLSLEERYWLTQQLSDTDDDLVTVAVQRTCDAARRLRTLAKDAKRKTRRRKPVPVQDMYAEEYQALAEEGSNSLFADGEKLLTSVLSVLNATDAIQSEEINGRPAQDVLAERLDELDWPEFHLLAACVLSSEDVGEAATRWLKSALATQADTDSGGDE